MYIYNLEIGTDKIIHILVSLLIFLVIFYVRKYIIKNKGFFRVVSYTIRDVLVIGLFKEFIDLFGFGNSDIKDFLADSFGVIIPIYIYYLVKESEKIDNSKFLKYEIQLINKLKRKIIYVSKEICIMINIKYRQVFFRKKLLLTLENKIEKYYFMKSMRELVHIIKIILLYTVVWLFNLVILVFKILFLALVDTFEIFFKSISIGFLKLRNIIG